MVHFEYFEPATIEEAVSLLERYGGEARVLAGGTDLVVQMRERTATPKYVVNIGRIPNLDHMSHDGQGLRIGALTTIRTIEKSFKHGDRYGILSNAAGQLGSVPVRNVATIGGNLCNASPSADMAPPLIGLSARLVIIGSAGERIVPIEDLFTGPGMTILTRGELLTEIRVPTPPSSTGGAYLKHAIRGSMDLAIVGVAAIIRLDSKRTAFEDVKIALGAVAPTPTRAHQAEEVLRGKRIHDDIIKQAGQVASEEACPISDVRGSAEYRKEMIPVFTRIAIEQALQFARST